MAERGDSRTSSIEVVSQLIDAISADRVDDACALVHPDVSWSLVARPALSQYHGRDGLASAIADMRAVYGTYHVEIDEILEDSNGRLSVLAHVVQETENGDRFLPPSRSTWTLLDGLVMTMDAETDDEAR